VGGARFYWSRAPQLSSTETTITHSAGRRSSQRRALSLVRLRLHLGDLSRQDNYRIEREVGRYPVIVRLQQVPGFGPLISLTFVLSIGDPSRFGKSRQLGPYHAASSVLYRPLGTPSGGPDGR
jgi:hypothetical protein